jgi:predicted DNA-binding transcriptional regulator AlpA
MAKVFIRIQRLCELTGLGRSSIYNRLGETKYADPEFPRPIQLSPTGQGAVRWDLEEVEAWMAKRMAKRGVTC